MKKLLILASLVLLSAPALAGNTVCLRHNEVDGWGSRDKHSMVVNDIFGKKYLLTLNGVCDDINFAFGVGFRPVGGFGGANCVDRGDHVIMRGGGASQMPSACWVTKVQLYTPDMAKADKLAKENHQPLATY